jgi:hypothetical protein
MSDGFRFIEEKSVAALAHLADRGELFDVIFIDGNHRFDDAFVDFTVSAKVCPVDGFIIPDDMWMPAIRLTVAFIRSNRKDFEEIKTPVTNIAAFRRIGGDAREWRHYVVFFGCRRYHDLRLAIGSLTADSLRRGARAVVRLPRP